MIGILAAVSYREIKTLFDRQDLNCDELTAHLKLQPDDVYPAMSCAAREDRLDLLACALDHRPSQSSLDFVLTDACMRPGAGAVIRALLDAGADANAAPSGTADDFPLWTAATSGDAENVRLLLGAGADPNVHGEDFQHPDKWKIPLVAAIRSAAVSAIAMLLDAGADANLVTPTLRRPLDIAQDLGDPAVIRLLRERGARVVVPDDLDLGQAARRGFVARVRVLLPEASPQDLGDALIQAVQEKQAEAAAAILEHGGVEPGLLGPALGQCIAFHLPEVVTPLIDAGVNLDAADNYYRTPPLVLAAERGQAEVVSALLAAGADLQARNEEGENALAAARNGGENEVVRLLEAAGATARTPAEIRTATKQKLSASARKAWVPRLDGEVGEGDLSRFGGLPWLRAGETWPACGDCDAMLTFFVQVDLGRVPAAAREDFGPGLLQLFHCIACDPMRPLAPDNGVRIIDPVGGAAVEDAPAGVQVFPQRPITGWAGTPEDYPHGEGNESALLPEERAVVFSLNRQGDKLGGWPNWVQDPAYPRCPHGDHRLDRMVLQIDSHRGVPYMWGDNGVGFVLQCPHHRDQVAFTWQCG
jgi:ankyrin repeat protein